MEAPEQLIRDRTIGSSNRGISGLLRITKYARYVRFAAFLCNAFFAAGFL
jgi:hypothetical protein